MLIPYPFALLTGAVAFDAAARATGRGDLARTARHMTDAGLVSALVAAVPGIVDYFGSVPRESKGTARLHAVSNLAGLALFALARRSRDSEDRLSAAALAATIIATGAMSLAGWMGGELIYKRHVAVVEEGEARQEREAAHAPRPLTIRARP